MDTRSSALFSWINEIRATTLVALIISDALFYMDFMYRYVAANAIVKTILQTNKTAYE